MAWNKVVVRYLDGRVLKGITQDFLPGRDVFHVTPSGGEVTAGVKPERVGVADLKAVFFVKNLAGDPSYTDRREFDAASPTTGRKIRVTFSDGEVLVGTTQGYDAARPGFFVVPADPASNITRCYVFRAATASVELI